MAEVLRILDEFVFTKFFSQLSFSIIFPVMFGTYVFNSLLATWKPMRYYTMILRALDTYFVRAGNIVYIGNIYQACVKKELQYLVWYRRQAVVAWTNDNAGRSYDKYGASEHCKDRKGRTSGISERSNVLVYQKK